MTISSAIDGTLCRNGVLARLFDAMPEGLLYVDARGTVLAASARFGEFFGLAPEDLVGKPLDLSAEPLAKCFTEFMSYHEIVSYPLHDPEHEFLRDVELSSPKHRFLQVMSSPVAPDPAPDGAGRGRLWLMRDVTSEREITELKIQYGGARGADELKSRFLTVISHQLRTPLNAVRWNTELLLAGDSGAALTAEARSILREIYKAIVGSISIVDDMLMAVDIEQRAMRLEKTEVDVADVLTKAVHGIARSAELKGVKIALRPTPADLPRLFVDGDRIEKAFSRVLDNAVRYTPKGGTVTVSAAAGKDDVSVSVSDTGIGIPEKDRPRVFERFYRSKAAVDLLPDASGLGLYICKFIIDAHDGTIDFTSEEGRGTTFVIRLPRRPKTG